MKKKHKIIGVIPARLKSTRLPEKMLLKIKGKPLVFYTYKQAVKSRLDDVVIAVDNKKLYEILKDNECKVVMTSAKHRSGTDRLGEVAVKYKADHYINIQGDEPLIKPAVINKMIDRINEKKEIEILTIGEKITEKNDVDNSDIVKIVIDKNRQALYFSRNPIPYDRDKNHKIGYIRHIGIYAFRKDVLKKIVNLPLSSLEKAEKLEQLRFLENGFMIDILMVKTETVGVDTLSDFYKVKKIIEDEK